MMHFIEQLMLRAQRTVDAARGVAPLKSDADRLRNAAMIISDLLAATGQSGQPIALDDYGWTERGLEWLRGQWKSDPETQINSYTAALVRRG